VCVCVCVCVADGWGGGGVREAVRPDASLPVVAISFSDKVIWYNILLNFISVCSFPKLLSYNGKCFGS
jgi:hypothetical protein